MSIVIVPDSLKAKLEAADGPMTLYMSDGRILGLFTPTTGRSSTWSRRPSRRANSNGAKPPAEGDR